MTEKNEFVLLEDNAESENNLSHYFYGNVQHIVCFEPQKIQSTFDKIESLRADGNWLVGFFSYELGYALDKNIVSDFKFSENFPLIHFMAFEHHSILESHQVSCLLNELMSKRSGEAFVYDKKLGIEINEYSQHIEKIKKYIVDGYTYQVNYTDEYTFNLSGDPLSLYYKLRSEQKVHYGALLCLNDYTVLSLSPELFFLKNSNHLYTKPMKGTMPRNSCKIIDDRNKNFLKTDEKSRAENLMIVDLLRNDLSKISKKASVNVKDLFDVETYKTVHQMTSTVTCQLNQDMMIFDIIKNIFPCGSITGAPKHKTMQIINELEKRKRGLYTGSIGYISPSNNMCFNVAIRTIMIKNHVCKLGVGGGIVYDSDTKSEFDELKLKSKFINQVNNDLELFESILYKKNIGYQYLDEHLQRLSHSANTFGFTYDVSLIKNCLLKEQNNLNDDSDYEVKLILFYNGKISVTTSPVLSNKNRILKLVLCKKHKVSSSNILLKHNVNNTSTNLMYNQILTTYREKGYDDVILMNEQNIITQTCLSNIFFVKNNEWFTSGVECGLVPGIIREKVIKKTLTHIKNIEEADLINADEIWLAGSIIELVKVEVTKCEKL